jgi:hypothetical protein
LTTGLWKGLKMLKIIATERINTYKVETLATKYFPVGFTTLEGIGFWGGVSEKSLLILVAGEVAEATIKAFCDAIKVLNNQECLMVIEIQGEVNFI